MVKNEQNNEIEVVEGQEVEKEKQKGASLVEYALLVALIAVVCIVAIRSIGKNASGRFSTIASAL